MPGTIARLPVRTDRQCPSWCRMAAGHEGQDEGYHETAVDLKLEKIGFGRRHQEQAAATLILSIVTNPDGTVCETPGVYVDVEGPDPVSLDGAEQLAGEILRLVALARGTR